MKTRSLLIKMISDGENNLMQNNCNKCTEQVQKFIIPNHKNGNKGSSAIHLHAVYMIDT